MKNLSTFVVIAIMSVATPTFAQEEKLAEHDVFCVLVAYEKLLNTKVRIEVDFGDPKKPNLYNYILDESGKAREFYSLVDGLNYMASCGWEFVQVYVLNSGESSTAHYLFRKKYSVE